MDIALEEKPFDTAHSSMQDISLDARSSLDVAFTRQLSRTFSIKGATDSLAASDTAFVSVLPRDVDPTRCHLAYGRQAIPKLVSQLEDGKLHSRQKALVFLADLCHSPENVVQSVDAGIVDRLIPFLSLDDLTCRQKATEILSTISGHAIGRADIIHHEALKCLMKLFTDPDDLVRKHTFDVICSVTAQEQGVQSTLQYSFFVPIVERLSVENMEIQVSMLNTCYNYIRFETENEISKIALENHAMEQFTNIARKSLVGDIKVAACRCIMMLSFFHEAKRLATETDTVLVLITLLSDRRSDVRAAAAGALMSITIDCDAKRVMVRENALPILIELLSDTNELVLLNVIKTITNCAEDYRGRFQLQHGIQKLEKLVASDSVGVAEAAQQAIAVIMWRP
ncbi:hypothetical protein BDV3_003987 [Batrachochytrium dendrobatidis]|uniref:Condensin complex subunit 1 C-terminal domain-containing protein n=1 Tax=Batrachochytrium dendrobatidis (strain JEL423) TaxID=403673 RepID=A0A177WEA2_BATDL|nr:hypothetical protein BDEG_22363 [Batrachochytrium dendrobatidis JEL423]